ncbi:LOG family protein [Porticoccus sp. W117]|uniref:LOG family protein n=1 Tax=Porticoccus sp. W117 TaxID=3054777 RepID=UPI0025923150|nr:LOG family protein [Porticoccus sp. W117]MDM3872349.1 LOG family protein [Porticoccus sp. W117]
MNKLIKSVSVFSLSVFINGCVIATESQDDIVIRLNSENCDTHGERVKEGKIPTPAQLAKDAYCAKLLVERVAPNGIITIFGSSRTKEDQTAYINTRTFARDWTKAMGKKYPVLTGGGGGIMEAGNRGAYEAGGPSLAFSSYFKRVDTENLNSYITDGYIASSFSQREADMVDYAAAVIIAPGGVGTEWEIFETIAKIQTRKKDPVPVLLLGKKEVWQTLLDRLNYLNEIKTISPRDLDIIDVAETPEEAIKVLLKALK